MMRHSAIGLLVVLCVGLSGCRPSVTQPRATRAAASPETTWTDAGQGIDWQPLASATSRGSATQFQRISADASGLDFVHQWNPSPVHERELANAVAGGGVAIGDYDADGLADIFLTRPHGGPRLYHNEGDMRFRDATVEARIEAESMWATGASFVDIDNDQDLDLFVCGFDCPNRLYVNQGDGTFREQAAAAGMAFRGASIMMAFADYDNDGDLDGYLVTNRLSPLERFSARATLQNGVWVVPEEVREYKDVLVKPDGTPFPIDAGQYDHLFRNDGPGVDGVPRFVDVSQSAGIAGNHFGLSATWWDFDDNGIPDLYVSNDFYGPDQLYYNNGDGTFRDVAPLALAHTPWFSMGTDLADINNDGRMDLLATDMLGTNHFRQKVAMGEMSESSWFLTSPTPRQYMRNALFLNTGTGRFMEVAYLCGLASSNWTWSVNFGDFDNDGQIDLFISNGMTRDWFHSDMRSAAREEGEWQAGGREYWLNSPELRERNLAFRNAGDYRFENVSKAWGLDELSVSFGAAVADLDADGDLDLVVNNFAQPASLYRNGAEAGHRLMVQPRGTQSNRQGIGATVQVRSGDQTQVRQLWPTHGFMSCSPPVAHFGLGASATAEQLTVRWPSGHVQTFEQLPADRIYRVTEPGAAAPTRQPPAPPAPMFARTNSVPLRVHQENEFDDYAVQPLLPSRLSRLGPGMAWGDANGDGQDDLFVGGAAQQAGTLLIQDQGRFQPAEQYFGSDWEDPFTLDAACEDMGALWFDPDSDGDLDLFVASGGYEFAPDASQLADRLYVNDGHGKLTKATPAALPPDGDSSSTVAAADFDRDGDVDLFVGSRLIPGRYPETPSSRLLRNTSADGQIRFVDVTRDVAPELERTGLVTSALWSDIDNDGWPDLLVAHEWGPIRVLVSDNGRLVDRSMSAGTAERLGHWNALAGRDLDNDGDIDFVAANLGLNTKYHASPERPALLYYGDFDGSGVKQLVEAEFEDGTMYPVRGRSCSSTAMPSLASKFPTFESFALASLTEIYEPRGLSTALKLAVNSLESCVLINDGNGRFEYFPLPRIAQASPAFGTVIADFDGDGTCDIFLNQNSFSPQPETGNLDGGVGLLLRGVLSSAGAVAFQPLSAIETGIVLAGDGKSLTVTDLNQDGRLDLVAGMNNGPVLAFQNRAEYDTNQTRTIRLRGPVGNPQALGARVTLTLDDGRSLTAEVQSNCGYLSQSSLAVVFGIGNTSQPQQVTVRWPDGTTSRQAFPARQPLLEITRD